MSLSGLSASNVGYCALLLGFNVIYEALRQQQCTSVSMDCAYIWS